MTGVRRPVRARAQAEEHEDPREQLGAIPRSTTHSHGADVDAERKPASPRATAMPNSGCVAVQRVTGSGTIKDAGRPMNPKSDSSAPAVAGATPEMSTRRLGTHASIVEAMMLGTANATSSAQATGTRHMRPTAAAT
ncbi:hypothetical protein [Microbacterium sp. LWH3-1.2]|uniref:hypothetical protein n=1 Tax=Microbacterium sp. LWH3-1.2 TaxID=3135256 RepID=UPI00342F7D6F